MSDAGNPPPIRPVSGDPSHRPASVTLRASGAEDTTATMMDPANQSLAEALRITFWILQMAMLVIFGLFLLSGFQSIKENESGIRLLFGRVTGSNLPSGFQFSWPYPLGELIKVNTGAVTVEIDEAFWPSLTSDQKRLPLQQLAAFGRQQLKPGTDGSLVTADRNLAHSKWTVTYVRSDPENNERNIFRDDEQKIVRAAVQRGVVLAVAETTIDDLLKQSASDQASVATRARTIAQESLDRMGAGIRLEQCSPREKTPPLFVFRDFNEVQSAEQRAGQLREAALGEARNTLNAVAGAAHPHLIDAIDDYERAVERQDAEAQARVLETLRHLLDGRPVEVDGARVEGLASGRVTSILSEARGYTTQVVTTRRTELANYKAKLEQFQLNPEVVINRDWSDAMIAFLSRDTVEKFFNPPGTTTLEILINRDPEIVKAIEQARKLAENLKAAREREERGREERFRTDTQTQSTIQ